MDNFLGETLIDASTHPEFKHMTPQDWALRYIGAYGGIDGSHHKAWVLDQVARILLGTPMIVKEARWGNGHTEFRDSTGEPSQAYLDWVKNAKAGEDGPDTYSYDEGIAP